jgi:thiol-disulfide isomerase/thioredoxin
MRVRLHFLVGILVAAPAFAAPPTDTEVAQAEARYNEAIKRMQAEGSFNPSKLGAVADEAVAGLSIGEMTLAQIESLMGSTNLCHYTSKGGAFDDRLSALAAAPTVDGARAAVARLGLLGSADAAKQRAVIVAMLDHPKTSEALADAGLWGHFGIFGWGINPSAVKGLGVRLAALGAGMPETLSVHDAALAAPALYDGVIAAGASPEEREPLRARLVVVLRKARERYDPADPELKNLSFGGPDAGQYLEQQVRRLEGPAGRGTLVGGPAPALNFEWTSAGRPIASLADLKGKVVVLDFWSTWCGPCVGSFPKIRETAARYKGFGVEIVGVTSLQGHHHELGGKTIDCKGDPVRERALMGEYVKTNDISWTIAFSKEPVFNPDYGVRGIPAVFVIDGKGVVRHTTVSFHDPARLHEGIDALLKEAGLAVPAP